MGVHLLMEISIWVLMIENQDPAAINNPAREEMLRSATYDKPSGTGSVHDWHPVRTSSVASL